MLNGEKKTAGGVKRDLRAYMIAKRGFESCRDALASESKRKRVKVKSLGARQTMDDGAMYDTQKYPMHIALMNLS
jgi:hypothetical protein